MHERTPKEHTQKNQPTNWTYEQDKLFQNFGIINPYKLIQFYTYILS